MPACLTDTRAIHRRTDSIVFTSTARGTVYPIASQRTRGRAVNSFESRGAGAPSCHTVTISPILAAADLLASFPIESRRACFITVESRPARLAATLSRHGMTAMSVVQVAGAPLVTFDAVQPFGTQARLTKLAGEACFTQACSTHVIALPSVNTPAGLRTASSIGPDRTFVLTPFPGVSWAAVTLACGSVTRSSVVALAFL